MFQILIVEDDKELSQLFQKVLVKNGYQVKSASDGAQALEVLDKEYIDLIISDIMMPVMDGYQALMGIRNLEKEKNIPDDKRVKVIMATALNEEKNVKMAFDLGCTIYSGKPIDQAKFEQALKKIGLIDEK